MQVSMELSPDALVVRFEPETADSPSPRRGPRLGRREVTVELEEPFVDHPDLLGLTAVLLLKPWASTMTLQSPVSRELADAASSALGIELGPVDPTLPPRSRPTDGRPGLAYSGGADCTAALIVMPDDTAAYFMERVMPEGVPWVGSYDKSAALHACRQLADRGRLVRVVQSDMEFIREPYGFPHDLANAIPAILSADRDRLDSIGWGAILESTYRIGSQIYQSYEDGPFIKQFGPLFDAVGLPIFNPVAGVSEVGTAMIVRSSPLGEIAQSCMRGTVGAPCRRCWKCTRKVLLDAALDGHWPSVVEINRMLTRGNTPYYLRKEPLKHEGVVAYLTAEYPRHGTNDLLRALADRIGGYPVDWLTRWYEPSMRWVPAEYRDSTTERLDAHLERMSAADVGLLTGWNLKKIVGKAPRKAATAQFLAALDRTGPRDSNLEQGDRAAWAERLTRLTRAAQRRLSP